MVEAKQASGKGKPGSCCCSTSQGRVQASSNGDPPDSVASSTACAPSAAPSSQAMSRWGVRAYRCMTASLSQCRSSTTSASMASCSKRFFRSSVLLRAPNAAAAPRSAARTTTVLCCRSAVNWSRTEAARATERSAKERLKLPPSRRSNRPWCWPSTCWASPIGLANGTNTTSPSTCPLASSVSSRVRSCCATSSAGTSSACRAACT